MSVPHKDENQEMEYEERRAVLVHRVGRKIYFFDEVNAASVLEAIKFLDILEAEDLKKPITILFDSEGGNVYDGLALYDRMRICKSKITTIGLGLVASMAFVIFMGGDRRVATSHVRFLNHQTRAELRGKLTDIEIEQTETKVIEEMCIKIISERTSQTAKRLRKDTKVGDKYIGAEEALRTGIIHEVIQYTDKE